MPLTFPRSMPTQGADRQTLEIMRVDYATPETGGRSSSVTAGFPLWVMRLELGNMGRAEADAWRAFVASLRGSARTFYARDLLREYPAAYPNGFGGVNRGSGGAMPANGAATSWSVNGTRDVLTLNGMPANMPWAIGDLVGFVWSTNRRTIARCVEAVTASAAGVATFSIEPPLPTIVPGGATTVLQRPELVMRLNTQETQVGSEDTWGTQGGTIAAVQDLRA